MKTHYFNSTDEAYDACQCDENIKKGDLLVVENEEVIGVADTYPVAVTMRRGEFHGLPLMPRPVVYFLENGLPVESLVAAESMAAERDW
jgi:hypothetical protein